ncbi:MAG: transcriptional repressor LexA [Bacillota bacterium]|nr:transcriptional repressor LexA [Bacillota bacterium]MDW7678344.1 transcriptional repressor LexA [Bacillota bacterium]
MYEDLTAKQKSVLEYMKKVVLDKGYPPSVREICTAVDLRSTSTVHNHLLNLEKKGYIRRDPTKPRAVEIFDIPFQEQLFKKPMIQVPILGSVTAGEPMLAIENVEDFFPLPISFVETNEEVFMLTIQGTSMIDAGIYDGDYVLVKKQNTADNGDIVVALLEDEATVKRFYKENGHFRLQPENSTMQPIIVDEVAVLGRVIGLIRRF